MTDDDQAPAADDPVGKARASLKRVLPKRFYADVTVSGGADGFRVLLDGRPIRTPARNLLGVADPAVAEGIAQEWRDQRDDIDPDRMPLTRLVNTAIDGVAATADAVADEIAGYAASDLLFYRAAGPSSLVARQTEAWDPILAAVEARLGVRFRLAEGVMPVEQDPAAVAAVRAALPSDPFHLAGLSTVTSLTGSVLLALVLFEGLTTPDVAWAAAHLDEDWNAAIWGIDAEAVERRRGRRVEFDAAVLLLQTRPPRQSD